MANSSGPSFPTSDTTVSTGILTCTQGTDWLTACLGTSRLRFRSTNLPRKAHRRGEQPVELSASATHELTAVPCVQRSLFIVFSRLLWALSLKPAVNPQTGKEEPPSVDAFSEGFSSHPLSFKCRIEPRGDWVREVVDLEWREVGAEKGGRK